MTKKLDDSELLAITGNEIRQSIGYSMGKLSEARRRNLQYYIGRAVGDLSPPEIQGRSSVVSTDVHDTIEWMLPSLIKTFAAGDSVVEFVPQREEDEDAAQQATDYVNYVFYRQNPGFQILNTWFKDALLSKLGVLKVMWDDAIKETREEYNGLDDMSLQELADDKEITLIEHTSRPDEDDAEQRQKALSQLMQQLQHAMQAAQQGDPKAMQAAQQMQAQVEQINATPPKMLHDVAAKRTKSRGQVRIYNVPPEEFMINRDAKTIETARFVAHQVLRSLSDLKAAGYKNTDDLTSDDTQAGMNMERVERVATNDEMGYNQGTDDVPGDPSQKRIWVTECYMQVDADGDGIAEWRKLTRAGDRLLDNEECDGPPFVSITPVPLPHQLFGLCPADQAVEIQKQKTAVMRAVLDNLYLSVNGRYFAVDGQVNLDDLLTSRPGGVVRVKTRDSVGRLDQGSADAQHSYQLLDYLELQKEQRTGLMRNTQGVNPDAMNQTATGINIMTNRADSRLELIARQFAETGVRDMFRMILKLISQHQDKDATIRVSGKWVSIEPRAWRNQYDMSINVGLGTGNKDQEVNHLLALVKSQQEAFGAGIVTPDNIYQAHKRIAQALGFKQDGLFFSDPEDPSTKQKMPPPPPNPDQMKAQAQQQIAQMNAQATAQAEQAKTAAMMQVEQHKMELQARVDQNRQQQEAAQHEALISAQMQQKQQEAELKAQVDYQKHQHEQAMEAARLAWEREKNERDNATKILIAQISANKDLTINAQRAEVQADAELLDADSEGASDE